MAEIWEDPWTKQYVTPQQVPINPGQPSGAGGGFWQGLLGILRNVPITLQGPRGQTHTTLPSFNELTAGSRLYDYGKSLGVDMGPTPLLSPGEAQLRLKSGLEQRQLQPIGIEAAEQLFPTADLSPEAQQFKRLIALTPRKDVGALADVLVKGYGGVPGLSSRFDPSAFAGLYDAGAPSPASPVLAPPPAPPSPAPGVGGGSPVSQAAPSTTATLQAMPGMQGGLPPMPTQPPAPSLQITEREVQADPDVAAARVLAQQRPYDQALRAKYATAYATAGERLQKARQQQYALDRQNHAQAMQAWKAQVEAMHRNWGLGQELTAQIVMDHGNRLQPGQQPTQDMINYSHPRMVARLQQEEAQKTELTRRAGVLGEAMGKQGVPITQALGPNDYFPLDAQGNEVTTGTLGEAQQKEAAGEYTFAAPKDRERMANLRLAANVVRQGKAMLARMYDILKQYEPDMTPAERADPMSFLSRQWDQITQKYPELIATQRFFAANTMALARGVYGGKGDLNARELDMAMASVPQLENRLSAIGGLGLGPIRVPLGSPQVPDTKNVALMTLDTTMDTINRHGGDILRRPGFQFPGVTPRTAEEQRAANEAEREAARRAGEEGKLDQKAYEARSPFREGLKKTKQALGLTPGEVPKPAATSPIQKAMASAMRDAGVTTIPTPAADAPRFQAFMTTVREHLRRNFSQASPTEIDQLTGGIAQKYGGTWQPPR